MKAVIGLGNPEIKYMKTRHNIGFMILDEILKRKGLKLSEKFNSFFAKSGDTLFLLPKTYMNLSGRAVVELMNFYKLSEKDILVVFDDVSLNLGKLRFRANGSDGGHNGIKSIINSLSSQNFDRLKVGIGPKPEQMPLESFVLGNFAQSEQDALKEVIQNSTEAIEDYLNNDFTFVQNKWNAFDGV